MKQLYLFSKLCSAVVLGTLLAGCVRPIAEVDGGSTAPRDGKLEVRVFQGGYGVDFFEEAAREYEQTHPGVDIDLKGDPRIWDQLRPRFVAGDPPGLTFPGWGMDVYALIYERQVTPLDDVLLTTPHGASSGTWRDTFLPDVLKLGEYNGQTYLLPYYLTLNGWWYNVKLFEQHGWQPPRTYDDLLALAPKIKAAGIAPITYQGKYPVYAIQGFLIPWAISIGGMDVLRDVEALKPGAWKHPAFQEAAKMIVKLRDAGYFQNGANGMSHTEAQMEFLQGKAAMIPCGTWLESEMKQQLPPGFQMEFIRPPYVSGGKGDPTTVQVGVEPWLVPVKGRNAALAVDFFKFLTSEKKAREFVQKKGTLMSIKSANDGDLPRTLVKPAQALKEAKETWTARYVQWYKPMDDECRTAMSALLQGTATPEQFLDRVEAAAEKLRQDPNVPKPGASAAP